MLGGFAEVALAQPHFTFPLPDELDFAQGAGLILNYHTAYFALKLRGRLAEGETVLVHGAAGGVGTAALQVAKGLGARTIAVVSTDEKEQIAREAGADEVLRSDGEWKDDGEGALGRRRRRRARPGRRRPLHRQPALAAAATGARSSSASPAARSPRCASTACCSTTSTSSAPAGAPTSASSREVIGEIAAALDGADRSPGTSRRSSARGSARAGGRRAEADRRPRGDREGGAGAMSHVDVRGRATGSPGSRSTGRGGQRAQPRARRRRSREAARGPAAAATSAP